MSVEREDYAFRIDHLRRTPAAVKFLSAGRVLAGRTWDELPFAV